MSRIRLLFSEAWSSISQNISTTFAATMTVLIGMFLLGLFIALGTWVLSWSDHVKKELSVKVFFAGDDDPGAGVRGAAAAHQGPAREDDRLRVEGAGAEDDGEEVPDALRDAAAVEPAARLVGDHADEGRVHTRARAARSRRRSTPASTTCAGEARPRTASS